MNEKIKMPFWETLRRTFAYVWNDRKILMFVLPILIAFLVLKFVLSQTSTCDPTAENCNDWRSLTLSIAMIVMNIAIIINYCRRIVLKEEPNFTGKKFWKSAVFYFVASLIYFLSVLLPLVILLLSAATIIQLITTVDAATFANSIAWGLLLLYVIVFIEFVLLAPLLLWFPSIAVEDYKMLSLKKLFRLTKGNHNRLFWGLFVTNIPLFVLLVVIILAAEAIFGVDNLRDNNLLWLLGIVVQVLNTCLKGSYYAHTYQFFKFVEKKEKA